MPSLHWIGKEAVVNHHHAVPFHLLRDVPELSVGEPGAGNLIVQGDNLVALKALLPYYAGKVKCIYIDPPYNTGKENDGNGWVFNDRVTSPVIREWLGKTVGKEADDLSRHDKWLCMMYPRLALLKQFLAPDGVMFVSIDDIELPFLRILMDELFPHAQAKNRLACFIWETDGNFDNQAKVKNCHEYILAYSRCFEEFPPPPVIDATVGKDSKLFRPAIQNTIVKNGPKNPVSPIFLPAGFPAAFQEGRISARTDKWPHYDTDLDVCDGKLTKPATAKSGWSSKAICEEFIAGGFQPVLDSKGQKTRFVISATGAIETIKVRSDSQSHVISVIRDVGSTQNTSEALAEMGIKFTFPKPVGLISYLISMVSDKSALVLDTFAGSGTTAHAVMQLNKLDGGQRRFILAQLPYESDAQKEAGFSICQNLTAKRVKNVAEGYTTSNGERVEGLGGSFRFCELGEPLFDETGKIRASVRFADLARHVYFTETGEPLPEGSAGFSPLRHPQTTKATDNSMRPTLREVKRPEGRAPKSPLLGIHNGRAVCLLYNGILKDKSVDGGNALTQATLALLRAACDGQRVERLVVYGTSQRLSPARLKREGVTFKQIPYSIRIT